LLKNIKIFELFIVKDIYISYEFGKLQFK
jgi:hypothetical protein